MFRGKHIEWARARFYGERLRFFNFLEEPYVVFNMTACQRNPSCLRRRPATIRRRSTRYFRNIRAQSKWGRNTSQRRYWDNTETKTTSGSQAVRLQFRYWVSAAAEKYYYWLKWTVISSISSSSANRINKTWFTEYLCLHHKLRDKFLNEDISSQV